MVYGQRQDSSNVHPFLWQQILRSGDVFKNLHRASRNYLLRPDKNISCVESDLMLSGSETLAFAKKLLPFPSQRPYPLAFFMCCLASFKSAASESARVRGPNIGSCDNSLRAWATDRLSAGDGLSGPCFANGKIEGTASGFNRLRLHAPGRKV